MNFNNNFFLYCIFDKYFNLNCDDNIQVSSKSYQQNGYQQNGCKRKRDDNDSLQEQDIEPLQILIDDTYNYIIGNFDDIKMPSNKKLFFDYSLYDEPPQDYQGRYNYVIDKLNKYINMHDDYDMCIDLDEFIKGLNNKMSYFFYLNKYK